MVVTLHNKSTTEPLPWNGHQTTSLGRGGVNAFYWRQIFALHSAIVKAKKEYLTRIEAT